MKALGPIALATAIGCAAGGASGTVSPSTGAGTTSGGTPSGSVEFTWTFTTATDSTPLTCAAAGASTVVIGLGGNQITFPCLSADGGQTGTADGIAAGDVPYQTTALASDGVTQVAAGMPADVEVPLVKQSPRQSPWWFRTRLAPWPSPGLSVHWAVFRRA